MPGKLTMASGHLRYDKAETHHPRCRLLLISHVLPFPADSGQQQRVRYTLKALRERFHITVVVSGNPATASIREQLLNYCDEVVVLPLVNSGALAEAATRMKGVAYCAWTCEKRSNYVIGRLQFSPERLEGLAQSGRYDCVLYEYWHAHESTKVFRSRRIPVVLDMHNILWKARDQQLATRRWLPSFLRRRIVARYRRREERAWDKYDAVIAINEAEKRYTASRVRPDVRLFHVPMGVSLENWSGDWQPSQPPRVAYYGGLGSPHNQRSALECVSEIMPGVWSAFPEAELWLIGSNPPEFLRALASSRIKVTGFVEDVASVLRTMSAVLCPWQGTYGFRSRVVEVMALGVPVIAAPDAVYGMELEDGRGLLLASTPAEMSRMALKLLHDAEYARRQSISAREQIVTRFDFTETYGRLALQLERWLEERRVCV